MNENVDIAELLAARVAGARQVTTLVGDRIRPEVLEPNEPMPAVVYDTITSDPQYNLNGAAGFAFSRVQFNAYALTRREANAVAGAIEDVLDGFAGRLGEAPDFADVSDCTIDNKYNRVEAPTPGDGRFRFKRVIDFTVSHSTPIPSLIPE